MAVSSIQKYRRFDNGEQNIGRMGANEDKRSIYI